MMAREDIIAGLKNAIERGETIERAMQTFINAGYNPAEVKQAVQTLTQGATQIANPEEKQPIRLAQGKHTYRVPQIPEQIKPVREKSAQYVQPTKQQIKQLPTIQKSKKSHKNIITIIILIIILLLLIGALIYFIFNKEIITSLFS